jgi:2-oxoglutarate ferredoxin oxidoreductase subunit alpha
MREQLRSGINDFAFKLANVNGTGSASANGLLMQAIFRMGIPVSGKNLFPSNIQGLPTWYEIRVNKNGHTARALDYDLIVAMNGQTYAQDIAEVRPGGYVLYDSSWPLDRALYREEIHFLPIPLAQLCNEHFQDPRERILMKNIAYAGALVAALRIDMPVVEELLAERFSGKKALRESNRLALRLGFEYAHENLDCPLPFHLEKMDANSDKILIDGNTATALGCLYAGATVAAWYPITPATSVMDAFRQFCGKYRRDSETGRNNYLVIQAEDELAAIGMTIGAMWNGARAFTATSGPGVSLMQEFIGLAYYAEVPAVIFDIQRVGPSTGMPTRTQQCDVMSAAYASHGDTRHVCLYPSNPEECFYMAVQAFDLAERLQTPVFVMSDLDIGMNDWMCRDLEWDDSYKPDRGKVLSLEEITKLEKFYRYFDKDGDGIAYRTLPGTHPKAAYFARGSGHTQYGVYTEDSAEYQIVLDRLMKKWDTAKKLMPRAVIDATANSDIGIVSYGSCDGAIHEAIDVLKAEGVRVNYMRVRSFPFTEDVERFLAAHRVLFVVEQNRDAQFRSLLTLETQVEKSKLRSLLHYSGLPISSTFIVEGVLDEVRGRPTEQALGAAS